jgi:hypothetical protein
MRGKKFSSKNKRHTTCMRVIKTLIAAFNETETGQSRYSQMSSLSHSI